MLVEDGAIKYRKVLKICKIHNDKNNLVADSDVWAVHQCFQKGNNSTRAKANLTTVLVPWTGFALGNDDPINRKDRSQQKLISEEDDLKNIIKPRTRSMSIKSGCSLVDFKGG